MGPTRFGKGLMLSCMLFVLLALLISGWRYRGSPHPSVAAGVGGLAGLCSGLAQTGGPPIVTFWLGQPIASAVARANIVSYFAVADIFSIVGLDSTTGELGVAALARAPAVGNVVPWAQAGVGAVALGGEPNAAWGPQAIQMLREGRPVQAIVDSLVQADRGFRVRHVPW